MTFGQTDFAGGLDMFTEITRVGGSKYPLLINGRSRFGRIRPGKAPVQLTEGLPLPANATYQGLFAAGNYAIVVAGGKAYVRDYSSANETFISIDGFNLSPAAEEVWCSVVPASTVNFGRAANDDEPNTAISLLNGRVAPSPQCAVFQDGISRPALITAQGTARSIAGYQQWSVNNREYVPIGKQMLWSADDGIHYVVSADGSQLFRSVTGRPLDFMVAINTDGDKVSQNEESGGAPAVSHAVSFAGITCLGSVPNTDGGIFVGTKYNGFVVIPDYTSLRYGEPSFSQTTIVNTGTNNQNSFLGDVNGDSLSIDNTGIRSFNAVRQFKTEGVNSPFSLSVSRLFEDPADRTLFLTQTVTAATLFNNYAIFAVKTAYGNALLFFDTLTQVWESFDLYSDVAQVRQFAEVRTSNNVHKLLFLTTDGKIYEMFGGDNLTTQLYIGDFSSGNPNQQVSAPTVRLVFNNALEDGMVNASIYTDGISLTGQLSKTIKQTQTPASQTAVPYGTNTAQVNNIVFDFAKAPNCFRVGILLEWNADAELTHVVVETRDTGYVNAPASQVRDYTKTQEFLNGTGNS